MGLYYLPPFFGKATSTLFVSGLKTALVMWFYMRVRETGGVTLFYIAAGFIWLGLLALLTVSDYMMR